MGIWQPFFTLSPERRFLHVPLIGCERVGIFPSLFSLKYMREFLWRMKMSHDRAYQHFEP